MKILVKASYYRLARVFHPDRVSDEEKEIASEKFKILHQAYLVLANPQTKKAYDACDSKTLPTKPTVYGHWEHYFHTVDSNDIDNARAKYQGSPAEENDIIREIVIGKGSLTHLSNNIPFMRNEDEPRIMEIIKRGMEIGKIPKMVIRKIRHVK